MGERVLNAPRAPSRLGCEVCAAIFRTAFDRCPRDGGELAPLAVDPLLGRPFADRYVIEDCLGEGATGRVYRARHTRMSRRFAIKVLFGELAADANMRVRFAQEAEAASRLDHPNLVSVVDFGETPDGLLYLVMDYVEGVTLRDLMTEAPLPQARVVGLARCMIQGLEHAHQRGLIHRDFKPDNVIVVQGEVEQPRIVDFGLAILPEVGQGRNRLTTGGVVMGTPYYMAPEQASGRRLDARSDLYSLGVVLYEMLIGCTPFTGAPIEIARQHARQAPPAFAAWDPDQAIDPRLEQIVFRLLAKKPEHRFASATQVLEALAELEANVSPSPVGSARQSITQQLHGRTRALRRRWMTASALIAAAVVVAGALWARTRGAAQKTPSPAAPLTLLAVDRATALTEPAPPGHMFDGQPQRDMRPDAAAPVSAPAAPAAPAAIGATTSRRPRGAAAKKPAGEVTAEQLTRQYQRTGKLVDQLAKRLGDHATEPYRRRYFAVDYAGALRRPAQRRAVLRELEQLARAVKRAR